jgi:hypothetical protein
MVKRRAPLACVAAALVAGCSGNVRGQTPAGSVAAVGSSAPTSDPASTVAVATTCDSSTPIVHSEVQGVSADATVYGLLFLTHRPPIRVGDEVKIVWRMTGKGALSVTSESPTAGPGVLTFGPEPHGGSSYSRPGDEWGTGFLFDQPGCWHIHLQRTLGSGEVWFDVADA